MKLLPLLFALSLAGMAHAQQGWDSRRAPLLTVTQTLRCASLCLVTFQHKAGEKAYDALKSFQLERKPGEAEFTATWLDEGKEKRETLDCHKHGNEFDCH